MNNHTKTMPDGRLLDITKLIEVLYSGTYVFPLIAEIKNIKGLSKSRRTGFSKKRYENANLKYPVILDEDLNLLDGRHRILKALDMRRTYVSCLVASPEQIESCMVKQDAQAKTD